MKVIFFADFDMDRMLCFLYENRYILIIIYTAIINTAGFTLCGLDKLYAIKRTSRISERVLLTVALAAGATGMLFGMILFRHKTRKDKFVILIPMFILIHLCCILYLEKKYLFLSQLFL